MMAAMDAVGQRFQANEIFVPEMLISARAMKDAMAILEPLLAAAGIRPEFTAVIGTIKGDLHDIGKNLVVMMLKGADFEVVDLGTNVPAERFVQAAREHHSQLVGISALLTTTMVGMREVVAAIRASKSPPKLAFRRSPMHYKIVITDFNAPGMDLEAGVVRDSGLDVDLQRCSSTAPEVLLRDVADADAILVQFASIDRAVIEALSRCRVISRYGIGVDMVDVGAATERGIPVANVPDFCIDEVSTQTIGFVIDLNRHTFGLSAYVRAGRWGVSPIAVEAPRRLIGQTLGIVGLGRIGREVARKAACLGLNVIAFDPYLGPDQVGDLHLELVELEPLLRRSDYVSLHCPLVPETRGLIGEEQFAMMKSTACLINMSRGPVVDQSALYGALTNSAIAAAAVDVLQKEPPEPSDPLLQLENLIVTPHASSWSLEAATQLRRDTAQNAVEVLHGRHPRSIVNRAALGL